MIGNKQLITQSRIKCFMFYTRYEWESDILTLEMLPLVIVHYALLVDERGQDDFLEASMDDDDLLDENLRRSGAIYELAVRRAKHFNGLAHYTQLEGMVGKAPD